MSPTMSEVSNRIPEKTGRALKKSQTRSTLIRAAVELFAELGYADTTMLAVATRAGLHVQTLYKHFPNKEALAIAPEFDLLERFKIAMQGKDPETPFTSFWRDWVCGSATRTQTDFRDGQLQRLQTTLQVPAVVGHARAISNEYLNLLEIGLAEELKVDKSDNRYPRLFAGMLWEANNSATASWAKNLGRGDLAEEVTGGVDDVRKLISLWKLANSIN